MAWEEKYLKGVVLAGGLGTRLRPLTSVTNKHLLPVYNQPMIYYPIQTLVNAGITDIMVVTGGPSAGDFLRLLGNGKAFGLKHLLLHCGRDEALGFRRFAREPRRQETSPLSWQHRLDGKQPR